MIPLREVLARIRWDRRFGRGRFELAYLDRSHVGLVRVPLERVQWRQGSDYSFQLVDEAGQAHTVPFHRVREVRKDGVLIWQRLAPRYALTSTLPPRRRPRPGAVRRLPPRAIR